VLKGLSKRVSFDDDRRVEVDELPHWTVSDRP